LGTGTIYTLFPVGKFATVRKLASTTMNILAYLLFGAAVVTAASVS
jgi:hypothetical protein